MELWVSVVRVTMTSTQDTITRKPSITFHALRMYVSRPIQKPRAITWRVEIYIILVEEGEVEVEIHAALVKRDSDLIQRAHK